jgi:cytochrome c oxidase accessory protein FixG
MTDRASAAADDLQHETFRNELASVQKDGRRKWVYARQPHGPRYRARTYVSWGLLAFLFLAPFVTFRGQPLVLLNFLERRFVLIGMVFWPQDFYLVVLLALTLLVTLVLASATIGRVWCGWLCPQTVFLEMLFRKIEFLIDGSAAQQLRRDRAPWTFDKAWRRVVKHGVFFGLSFAIANVFLAYIIGADELWRIVTDPPGRHLAGLSAITIFSLLFYGVFARFREQACTLACPYGRLMSAFVDSRTVTVTYDWQRGEPRGHRRQTADEAPLGDCVDCAQCVTVCPTGIDIRNGIQLECVACTACMDACDDVMRKLDRPPGLIRNTSADAIRTGAASWLTTRVKAYAVVWTLLAASVITLLAMRRDLDVVILRQPGTLHAAAEGQAVANFYNVQIINRSNRAHTLEYRVLAPAGATITPLGSIDRVEPFGLIESRLLLKVPERNLTGPATPIRVEVSAEGRTVRVIDSSFLGPATRSPGP